MPIRPDFSIRRLRRIGRRRLAILIEAAALLVISRLAIAIVPFRLIAPVIGTCVVPSDIRVRRLLDAPLGPEGLLVTHEVSWAVDCAARKILLPTVCLHQSIAARVMLRRRRISTVMHFGASKRSDPLQTFVAHAWLEAPGVEVTGYPAARKFVAIASFL